MGRAINKTLSWAISQGLRAIARESDVPLSVLRRRRRGKLHRAFRRELSGAAWFGVLPVRAGDVGKPRQSRLGARVGKHFFDKAFVATMSTGHTGVFLRQRASRLPIKEQGVYLTPAVRALEGVRDQLADRFQTTFAQEFNYEVNVRGQA
jgi:hypothetical protein